MVRRSPYPSLPAAQGNGAEADRRRLPDPRAVRPEGMGGGEAFISLTLIMSAVRIVLPSRLFEQIPLDQLPLLTEAECMSSGSVNQSNLFE